MWALSTNITLPECEQIKEWLLPPTVHNPLASIMLDSSHYMGNHHKQGHCWIHAFAAPPRSGKIIRILGTSFRSKLFVSLISSLYSSIDPHILLWKSPGRSFHLCLLRFLRFALRRFKGSDGQGHGLTWVSSMRSNYINDINRYHINEIFKLHNSIQDTTKESTCIVTHTWKMNNICWIDTCRKSNLE